MASTPDARKYWCFISYRHEDNKQPGRQWATWLQQMIETYEVPNDLVGTVNERGDAIPERIFPVFRDEEELPVDADLASPIYRALDASKFLVVICSPRSVESAYVANEIRYFKQIGRGNRILAVMVEGEPNVSRDAAKRARGFKPEQECFPEALLREVEENGQLLERPLEPIAADFRLRYGLQGWTSLEAFRLALKAEGKDPQLIKEWVSGYRRKFDLMKLKIMAGILGVPLGELSRRDQAYQLATAQKRARVLRRWLIAICLLSVLALSAIAGAALATERAIQANAQRSEAKMQQARTREASAEANKQRTEAQTMFLKATLEAERTDAVIAAALQIAGQRQKAQQEWAVLVKKDSRWESRAFVDQQNFDPTVEKALASLMEH